MTSLPIHIPQDYEVLVSKGDTVAIGQVLARERHSPSELIIHLSKRLNVSPKSIGKYLRKHPGDQIVTGEVLAHKDGLFGDTVVISNLTGTLASSNTEDGTVTVKLHEMESDTQSTHELLSPLDGTVLMCNNDQIILETDKNMFLGEKGTGGTFRGLLKVLDVKDSHPIDAEKITVETIDSVIFGPAFDNEAIAKASAIGVGGILTLSLTDDQISYTSEKRLSLPVIQVTSDTGKDIAKWKRKEIFVDGKSGAILLLSYEKSTR